LGLEVIRHYILCRLLAVWQGSSSIPNPPPPPPPPPTIQRGPAVIGGCAIRYDRSIMVGVGSESGPSIVWVPVACQRTTAPKKSSWQSTWTTKRASSPQTVPETVYPPTYQHTLSLSLVTLAKSHCTAFRVTLFGIHSIDHRKLHSPVACVVFLLSESSQISIKQSRLVAVQSASS
jgi:hypothetical protein